MEGVKQTGAAVIAGLENPFGHSAGAGMVPSSGKLGSGGAGVVFCVSILWFLWCSLHTEDNLLLSATASLSPGIFYSSRKKKRNH